MRMGMQIPASAIQSILSSQAEWEKKREVKSREEYIYKRYTESHCYIYLRNLQKRAKKERHEREKVLMETLCNSGCVVGEYVGNGCGDTEDDTTAGASADVDAQPVVDDQWDGVVPDQSVSDVTQPLYFMFDCETTGLSIYQDHITEIAAEVVSAVPPSQPTYSSLVRTTRRIPPSGDQLLTNPYNIITYQYSTLVFRTTGISTALLRSERPLSVVLPEFLNWIENTVRELSQECTHYPGKIHQ